jgi:hypothetical protein
MDNPQYGPAGSLENVNERLIAAFETIGGALQSIAKTLELEYQQKYPVKKEPRDVDIHYIPTDEEQLRIEQGQTGEKTTQDWLSLGPRERAFREKEAAKRG